MSEQDDKNLFVAVEQATNPTISAPTILDEDALRPAPPTQSLADRMAAAKPTPLPDGEEPPKRKRGRPPGSKNKATLAREAQEGVRVGGPVKMVTPPAKAPKDDSLTVAQKNEIKLARAAELSQKVADTVNDNLMMLLMAMGTPTDLLYKPGMAPAKVQDTGKYTGFAAELTLGPMQANMIGRFLAELEATDTGGKVAGAATDGKGPLIVYGVLSAAAMIQWGKSLADAYKKLSPLLEAYQAQQAVAEQQRFNQQQTTGG